MQEAEWNYRRGQSSAAHAPVGRPAVSAAASGTRLPFQDALAIYNLNMALVDCVLMQTQKYLLSSLLDLVAEVHIPCSQGICSLIGVPT